MSCCPTCRQALPDLPDLIIDPASFLVRHGNIARLTKQELAVFEALRERPGRVMSQQQLLASAYFQRHDEDEPELKIIDVWICKLRKKIAPLGLEIQTVWGQGFRFVPVAVAREEAA